MILVTGGTGLVGAHTLLHLTENGERVRAIYRDKKNISKTKNLFGLYQKADLFHHIEWVPADITDVPALEKIFEDIDYVYHCAALISFDPKDEELLRKINIEGTANIVNFCLIKGIKKLCYVSSVAALGDLAPNEITISEKNDWNPEKPHSDYAISKYGAEMEIWRGQQEGLDVIIVNPGIIIGPGFEEQGSGQLFSKVAKGISFYTKGITGFVAIPDVIKPMVELMKSEIKNERFTLVAENIAFREILNTMADSLKVKRPSFHAKPWMLELGWRIDGLLSLLFRKERKLTKTTARAAYNVQQYSNEKIKSVLKTDFTDVKEYITVISNLSI